MNSKSSKLYRDRVRNFVDKCYKEGDIKNRFSQNDKATGEPKLILLYLISKQMHNMCNKKARTPWSNTFRYIAYLEEKYN